MNARANTVVVSHEDLLGSSSCLLTSRLYIDAHLRVKILLRFFPKMNIFIGIRPLESILISAYTHVLKFNPRAVDYFSAAKLRVASGALPSYVELFRRISSVVGRSRLFFWTIDDYIANPDLCMQTLTGMPIDADLEVTRPEVTRSPNAEKIRLLERLARSCRRRDYPERAREILRRAVDSGKPYEPFGRDSISMLRERYSIDLVEIEEYAVRLRG